MECRIWKCDRPASSRGLCGGHYARWLKQKDLNEPLRVHTPGPKTCKALPGCGKPVVAKGLCAGHYRQHKLGRELTPLHDRITTNDLLVRLRHYAPEGKPEECWLWTSGQDGKGYGSISTHGSKKRGAHVVAWELANERKLPAGKVVRHSCDTPLCTNPAHLQLGTHGDNVRDCIARGRRNTPDEPRRMRHRTLEERSAIFNLHQQGLSHGELAEAFGCSRATISRIVRGIVFSPPSE